MHHDSPLRFPPGPLPPKVRAIAKAVTWQIAGLFCSTGVGFMLTGSLVAGGQFAVASAAVGTVMFVLHERIWDRLS